MERELGLSYPTIRSRVEALVRALGFGARADAIDADDADAEPDAGAMDPAAALAARQGILERLARHEISAEDAADAIRSLGRDLR
jgi:hypothetical protein